MGIFNRASDIIQANLNALLDKAEQPEKMIRLVIQEMEEAVVELRGLAANHIAEQKRLEREAKQLHKSIESWQVKAELALDKGREDLAKVALQNKLKAAEALEKNAEISAQVEQQVEPIRSDIERLQSKLDEAKQRERQLHQRLDSVAIRLQSEKIKSSSKVTDAMQKYENYERRVEDLEAKLEAYDIGQSSNPSLDQQFKDLEDEGKVDAELEQLKAKRSGAPA